MLFIKVVCFYLVYGGFGGYRYFRIFLVIFLGICFYNLFVRGVFRGVVFISDLFFLVFLNLYNYVIFFILKEDIFLVLIFIVLYRKKNILDKRNKIRNRNYILNKGY